MPDPRSSRGDLRLLLMYALPTDSDQDAFVLDYFTDVFRRFTSGMDRLHKLNILFEWQETGEIFEALQLHAPARVRKFMAQTGPTETTPKPPDSQPATTKPEQTAGVPHVICLHAAEDRDSYEMLKTFLRPQLRAGSLTLWGPADTSPGESLEGMRRSHLEAAAVVVLLVSSDLLADAEMDRVIARALARRTQGLCIVVPILLRAAAWKSSPFGALQPLPRDGQPIRERRDRDAAWVEVVEGLLLALRSRTSVPGGSTPPSATPNQRPVTPVATPEPPAVVTPSPTVSGGVVPLFVPPALRDALQRRTVVPFAGAGVSRAVRRLSDGQPMFPDWRELLLGLADELNQAGKQGHAKAVAGLVEIGKSEDYLAAAKRAKEGLGSLFVGHLQSKLDLNVEDADPQSLALAGSLWTLGSKLIVTTNYDEVLSWACPASLGRSPRPWDSAASTELGTMLSKGLSRPVVWHLHGHVGNLANIILTPDGYQRLYPENPGIQTTHEASLLTLRTLLASRTFLFVGFSFTDEIFREQVRFMEEIFAGATGPHYMLVEQSKFELTKERLRGLSSLELMPFASRQALPQQLRALAALATSA